MKLIPVLTGILALSVGGANPRKPAPDFTLTDSKGVRTTLSSYKGKVVLLDFWATWCGGCQVEIPWFVKFENKYRDRGLAVLGVSMDEDGWKAVRPFLVTKKINYRIVLGDERLTHRYGVGGLPVTLLIDRQGNIVTSHAGLGDEATFEREIQALLK